MKFSIITVVLNGEEFIRKTVESVLNQSYDDWEYIIIDGKSIDNTVNIISEFAKSDQRINFISEADDGIYCAMNKGISMASGEYIGILNCGDYYEPTALEVIKENIKENSKYQIIYGMTRIVNSGKFMEINIRSHEFLERGTICHQSIFVSKKIYVDFGKYDIKYKYVADYDFLIRMREKRKINFVPILDIIVNYNAGGVSTSKAGNIEYLKLMMNCGFISRRSYWLQRVKILLLGV